MQALVCADAQGNGYGREDPVSIQLKLKEAQKKLDQSVRLAAEARRRLDRVRQADAAAAQQADEAIQKAEEEDAATANQMNSLYVDQTELDNLLGNHDPKVDVTRPANHPLASTKLSAISKAGHAVHEKSAFEDILHLL